MVCYPVTLRLAYRIHIHIEIRFQINGFFLANFVEGDFYAARAVPVSKGAGSNADILGGFWAG